MKQYEMQDAVDAITEKVRENPALVIHAIIAQIAGMYRQQHRANFLMESHKHNPLSGKAEMLNVRLVDERPWTILEVILDSIEQAELAAAQNPDELPLFPEKEVN